MNSSSLIDWKDYVTVCQHTHLDFSSINVENKHANRRRVKVSIILNGPKTHCRARLAQSLYHLVLDFAYSERTFVLEETSRPFKG